MLPSVSRASIPPKRLRLEPRLAVPHHDGSQWVSHPVSVPRRVDMGWHVAAVASHHSTDDTAAPPAAFAMRANCCQPFRVSKLSLATWRWCPRVPGSRASLSIPFPIPSWSPPISFPCRMYLGWGEALRPRLGTILLGPATDYHLATPPTTTLKGMLMGFSFVRADTYPFTSPTDATSNRYPRQADDVTSLARFV